MSTGRRTARKFVTRSLGTLTAFASIILMPALAEAQNAAQGKWSIELFGGGSMASGSTSGTPIASFAPGTPFTLASGQPSRAVSSWFYGDGALLLNQVLAQFQANAGTTFPRIASLDDALRSGGGKQGSGALFGLRLGRALSDKVSIEFSVERGLAKMELSNELSDALQEASETFEQSFTALLSTAPQTNLSVNATVTTRDSSSAQMRVAGALKWTVYSGSRLQAYLSGGGGLIMNSGDAPQAVLNGRYTFRFFGAFPMDESDRVVVTLNQKKNNPMGLVGAGFTFGLSSSSGLRADARLLLSSTKDTVTMTAAPGVVAGSPQQVLTTAPNIIPGLQFSTMAGVRSTLSGPNENLTIFTGSGLSKQLAVSLGIFKRF